MKKTASKKSLLEGYRFKGFQARSKIKGQFGDSTSLVIQLSRRQKKQFAVFAQPVIRVGMIEKLSRPAISVAVIAEFIWSLRFGGYCAKSANA